MHDDPPLVPQTTNQPAASLALNPCIEMTSKPVTRKEPPMYGGAEVQTAVLHIKYSLPPQKIPRLRSDIP